MTDTLEPEVLQAPPRDPATFSYMEQLAEDGLLDDFIAATPADERVNVLPYQWSFWGRPSQLLPEGDDWDLFMIRGGRGLGKLLRLTTPVPTPTGWSTMGALQPGDVVFDEAGNPTTVLAVYDDTPGVAYRLTFSDWTEIVAGGEHQWVTWTHADRKAFLRSDHESDRTRFPEDWPNWRVKRTSNMLSRDVVEQAIEGVRQGRSVRRVGIELGVDRNSIIPHIRAGRYIEQTPRVFRNALGPRVRTTDEIYATLHQGKRGDRNHCIPLAAPLRTPAVSLPLDPWLLGYWLGNGASRGDAVTAGSKDGEFDADHVEAVLRSAGWTQITRRDEPERGQSQFGLPGLRLVLRGMGLEGNKSVPPRYLRASEEQRLALLRGMCDSDGYVDPDTSQVEFCSTNSGLANGVLELARSLGERPVLSEGRATLNGRDMGLKYRVSWRPRLHNPFALPRKARGVSPPQAQGLRLHHRMITGCDELPPEPMRCITVDSPNSLYLAGDGMIPTHNTRAGAEAARRLVCQMGYRSGTVLGRNPAEARDVMVEGPTGIIAVHPPKFRPSYESSKRLITWPNGAVAHVRSAEDPDSLRGLNSDWVWADEPASFRSGVDAWDQAMFGNRIGVHPRAILTGTPRPLKWLRELEAKPTTRLSTGAMWENLTYLAPSFIALIMGRYGGTRLGRQEIEAEYLEDVEGAFWTLQVLERARFKRFDRADPWRSLTFALADIAQATGRGVEKFEHERRPWVTMVAVDPPGETAECGIVAGTAPKNGRAGKDHCVILDDMSLAGTPEVWGARVVECYRKWNADLVVVEKNQGGDMVRSTIHNVDPSVNVEKISAEGSKADRAEPVSVLDGKAWVHHLGNLPALEDQLCNWVPAEGKSPDRLDARVHLVAKLLRVTGIGSASLPDQRALAGRRL